MIRFSVLAALVIISLLILSMFGDFDNLKLSNLSENPETFASPSPSPAVANNDSSDRIVAKTRLPSADVWDTKKEDSGNPSKSLEREVQRDVENIEKRIGLTSLENKEFALHEKEIRIWAFVSNGFLSGFTSTNVNQQWVAYDISINNANGNLDIESLGPPQFGWEKWGRVLNEMTFLSAIPKGFPETDPDEGFLVVELKTGQEYLSRIIRQSEVHKADSALKQLCYSIFENFKIPSCGI